MARIGDVKPEVGQGDLRPKIGSDVHFQCPLLVVAPGWLVVDIPVPIPAAIEPIRGADGPLICSRSLPASCPGIDPVVANRKPQPEIVGTDAVSAVRNGAADRENATSTEPPGLWRVGRPGPRERQESTEITVTYQPKHSSRRMISAPGMTRTCDLGICDFGCRRVLEGQRSAAGNVVLTDADAKPAVVNVVARGAHRRNLWAGFRARITLAVTEVNPAS
ncbi:hypothetical protein MB901379_03404 [Mycobacterium basiliense]|uniref:Uncharacterized protein n=1 Tax=Mycobacterium basiliense TaxID=2094119 RepID=A0A3S4BXW9_9MYCO|nr:hypothetical protein MB901379_03404 [Mycobacterium basiliense]